MTLKEVMQILEMKKRNIEPTAQDILDSITNGGVN
jgi:hypothetical protein